MKDVFLKKEFQLSGEDTHLFLRKWLTLTQKKFRKINEIYLNKKNSLREIYLLRLSRITS